MSAHYEPTPHSVRAIAAAVALATVLALFQFVSGLGDNGAEAVARANAHQPVLRIATVAAPALHP